MNVLVFFYVLLILIKIPLFFPPYEFWSLIGATTISIGFYTVMWGKAKEEMTEDSQAESPGSLPTHKTPLLEKYKKEKR